MYLSIYMHMNIVYSNLITYLYIPHKYHFNFKNTINALALQQDDPSG